MENEYKNLVLGCQNCKKDFTIESEDFSFYEKIKVPPPTFCSECRKQRRLAFRNTHSLYKRKDSFSDKDIISIYSPDKNLVVIDQKTWWGDGWDPVDYALDYDFSKSFFEQWKIFRNKFPLQSLSNSNAVNSDYCNVAEESKDCYLISASWKNERVMYSDSITNCKDSLDLFVVHRTEFSYENVNCTDSYKIFYSQDSSSCTDSYFLYDCIGCTDCFMSSNQRNKSYMMYNQQYSKEEYKHKFAELGLNKFSNLTKYKKDFESLKVDSLHKFAQIISSQNVTGDNIKGAKNAEYCFDVIDGPEDSKYIFWGGMKIKDSYDCGPGIGDGELLYEAFDGAVHGSRNLFTSVVYGSRNVEYSFNCYSSSDLFGCIGLRNKQYCILNKQYTKEEFVNLRESIIKHMHDMPYVDAKGRVYRYGEFFPIELSPFAYNETVALDYYPLTKEEISESGYVWKDKENRDYVPTVTALNLPDDIKEVEDTVVKEVIECMHKGGCQDRCTTAFKILPEELLFCKRFDLPLPRLCYGCRHSERLKKRNPMKLWNRTCMCERENHEHQGKCEIEFETSYASERPQKVYCEKCYQKEVY